MSRNGGASLAPEMTQNAGSRSVIPVRMVPSQFSIETSLRTRGHCA